MKNINSKLINHHVKITNFTSLILHSLLCNLNNNKFYTYPDLVIYLFNMIYKKS